MKNAKSTLGSASALTKFVSVAGKNSTQTGELTVAAAEVVFRRMTLGFFAVINPRVADHAEFARMVPEKTRAFSDSGSVLFTKSMQIGQRLSQYAADETSHTAKTMAAIWTSRNPVDIMAAQANGAMSCFRRMAAHSEAICLWSMEAQGAAVAPIHRAATDNVKRLRH
jgi:hypothetical protein